MTGLVIVSIIIAILATISIISGWIAPIIMKVNVVTPSPQGENKGKEEKKEKKGWGVWVVVITLVATIFLTWGFTSLHEQRVASSGIGTVQPREEWVFLWDLPAGQYDRGMNSATFDARITKNDSGSLWFEVVYLSNGNMEVCHFQLNKAGDKYNGSWSQVQPSDGGNVYLKKVGKEIWTGLYTDKANVSFSCTLRRK